MYSIQKSVCRKLGIIFEPQIRDDEYEIPSDYKNVWCRTGKGSGFPNQFKGVIGRYTKEERLKISESTKMGMQNISPERKKEIYENRDNCNDRRWMNKDGKHKRVQKDQIPSYIDDGWKEGRLIKQGNRGRFEKVQ